jgi:hypothetical protein
MKIVIDNPITINPITKVQAINLYRAFRQPENKEAAFLFLPTIDNYFKGQPFEKIVVFEYFARHINKSDGALKPTCRRFLEVVPVVWAEVDYEKKVCVFTARYNYTREPRGYIQVSVKTPLQVLDPDFLTTHLLPDKLDIDLHADTYERGWSNRPGKPYSARRA